MIHHPSIVQFNRVLIAALVVLWVSCAGAAENAPAYVGFWSGFGDGFLSLLKFMASALLNVTIYDTHAQSWLYDAGYCTGAISFALSAGAAAFSAEPEVRSSRWK